MCPIATVAAGELLPVELIFNPNWWHRTAGIRFDEAFYLDRRTRIANDVLMRRVLYERYGEMGLGESDPQPRPVIGSMHVAGGFLLPALFGAHIVFADDQAPVAKPLRMGADQVRALRSPEIATTSPFRELLADLDALEREFGYVLGDFDTDGVLNTALCLRGEQLYTDMVDDPALAQGLFAVIAETQAQVAAAVKRRTGSCAIATNRLISRVDPATYLHSNCSVQMVSPAMYEELLLPVELSLANRLRPYGIHHCGNNMERFAPLYARVPATFFDVGWGSDIADCRRALPDAFFSLRLSPVRMLRCQAHEIAADTERLLRAAGPLQMAGVCCINMDCGTPDENIFAMFEVVQRHRNHGG